MISANAMPPDTMVKWLTATDEDFIKKQYRLYLRPVLPSYVIMIRLPMKL